MVYYGLLRFTAGGLLPVTANLLSCFVQSSSIQNPELVWDKLGPTLRILVISIHL